MSEQRFTNALIHEASPYLLQHAHNPVDWHPWGEKALSRAREEDKPILLSIGYSACHWCHVMEHESFENEAIAELMNKHFINIKVDREERPDLDTIYMQAVQMMTGHGGWPMTVFLTPDRVPFYGGTYFPPQDRHGLPGFPRVLLSVAQAYRERRPEILQSAGQVAAELRSSDRLRPGESGASLQMLDGAASLLMTLFDGEEGGFGGAPKFPSTMALDFLLRSYRRSGNKEWLGAVEHTLRKMACGGIYDQLGGGFHRYSVDNRWLAPHFEKMLYDNALLSRLYLHAWLATGDPLYRRITEETLDYVVREMTSPDGGFYSTQDADSEGHEGKFFLWTPVEIRSLLSKGDAEIFCGFYDVSAHGNFEGKNILHVPQPPASCAQSHGVRAEELAAILERGRRTLFKAREERIKPARDEKILAAWNGLMMRSFAEAAAALNRQDYREVAARNAAFILARMVRDGRLLRSCREGQARLNAYLEDYACLIDGLISLYEATFESRWLAEAERLAHLVDRNFRDEPAGNYFLTSNDHEQLIHRPKDLHDNATPSGNSVTAHAFFRLAGLTCNSHWVERALSIIQAMTGVLGRHPLAFGNYLCALDHYLADPLEIAIAGDPADADAKALLRTVFNRYLPGKVVACGLDEAIPLLAGKTPVGGRPAAYVCRNFTCSRPALTPIDLKSQLQAFDKGAG